LGEGYSDAQFAAVASYRLAGFGSSASSTISPGDAPQLSAFAVVTLSLGGVYRLVRN
jgi:hypothetical protein